MFSEIFKAFKGMIVEFLDINPPLVNPEQVTNIQEDVSYPPIPQCGIDLIKEVEGLRLKAYLDPARIPTIGYGHIVGVKLGDTCTQEQANVWLILNCEAKWKAILACVGKIAMTEQQGGALLCFTYNVGESAFAKSSILKKLKAGDYSGVVAEFKKWVYVKVDGKYVVSNGIVDRRRKEAALFNGGDWRVS